MWVHDSKERAMIQDAELQYQQTGRLPARAEEHTHALRETLCKHWAWATRQPNETQSHEVQQRSGADAFEADTAWRMPTLWAVREADTEAAC
jgi:hypothetical protein